MGVLLRIIFAAILVYLFYRICRRLFLPSGKKVNPLPNHDPGEIKQGEDLVEDPVCHTYLPISQAHKLTDAGQIFYFCSAACQEKFQGRKETEKGES
jgi:YHS domain-containing protein